MSGFAPAELVRLAHLKGRYDRGDFRELTPEERRLRFARWLVAQGRVNEAVDARDRRAHFLALLARPWPRRKVDARTVACRLPPRAR
jgi:hypothetical protein